MMTQVNHQSQRIGSRNPTISSKSAIIFRAPTCREQHTTQQLMSHVDVLSTDYLWNKTFLQCLMLTVLICDNGHCTRYKVGTCEASRFDSIRIGSSDSIRFESHGPIRKFSNRPCLPIARRSQTTQTALSGTVYRLASYMSDHTPVLFNVFEDCNEESVVSHISFDSIRIRFERKRPIRSSLSIKPRFHRHTQRSASNASIFSFAGPHFCGKGTPCPQPHPTRRLVF